MSFRAPVYFVAGETLFSDSIPSRLLRHCFAPIKKRKGEADAACIRSMVRVAREGGNVALFPEGNRTWADFPFYVDPAICSLIRLLKLPLLLYRFEGGYGVDPRWGRGRRRGRMLAHVYREISTDEIASMSDEALYRAVKDALAVTDGGQGARFRSRRRGEYLERLLFVCPVCAAACRLRSEGTDITCTACGLSVTYGEDLLLSSSHAAFHFSTLQQWYAYQLEYIKGLYPTAGECLYRDSAVTLYDETGEHRIPIATGDAVLTAEQLSVGNAIVLTEQILSVSVVDGGKLVFHTKEKSYVMEGDARFNAIKYALTFNALKTGIRDEKYYGLTI